MGLAPLYIGSVGIGSVEAINAIPPSTPTVEIIKLVIQLIIGIFSIITLKKNNPKK